MWDNNYYDIDIRDFDITCTCLVWGSSAQGSTFSCKTFQNIHLTLMQYLNGKNERNKREWT